jgi:nitroimidazol reductase NimA-like FMN-containing flavoprotein (pyridoxamine 5'-phosphate oxidase superfamily)
MPERYAMRNARDINKQVSRDAAMNILNNAEYGVLSTVDKAGQPYGVPLNYIVLNDAIYLHCALEGHKLDNISDNNRVSFTVIGYSEIVPAAFTAKYESVVVFGKANLVDEPEKVNMLKKLVQRYSPEFQEKGMKVIDAFKDKCTVIRIDIEHISGMRKK